MMCILLTAMGDGVAVPSEFVVVGVTSPAVVPVVSAVVEEEVEVGSSWLVEVDSESSVLGIVPDVPPESPVLVSLCVYV